jgi:hypothetical protein
MQCHRLFAVAGLTLCLFTALGSAQEPAVDTARIRAVERLQPGSRVRIATDDGGVHRGTLVRAGAAEIALSEDTAESTIRLMAMDSLWVARRSAGRGALIGGLVGVAAGAIAGAVACADCQDTPPEAVTVGGAAVGAVIGAAIGAGIGAVTTHWTRQYPK